MKGVGAHKCVSQKLSTQYLNSLLSWLYQLFTATGIFLPDFRPPLMALEVNSRSKFSREAMAQQIYSQGSHSKPNVKFPDFSLTFTD